MNFKSVLEMMKNGHRMKRPSWGGFWVWDKTRDTIMMHCRPNTVDPFPFGGDVALLNIEADDTIRFLMLPSISVVLSGYAIPWITSWPMTRSRPQRPTALFWAVFLVSTMILRRSMLPVVSDSFALTIKRSPSRRKIWMQRIGPSMTRSIRLRQLICLIWKLRTTKSQMLMNKGLIRKIQLCIFLIYMRM